MKENTARKKKKGNYLLFLNASGLKISINAWNRQSSIISIRIKLVRTKTGPAFLKCDAAITY